jgi:hypothetical protein
LQSCPEESLYVPALVALVSSALTTTTWASATKPKKPPVALLVATPRSGQGVVVGVGSDF